MNKSLNALIASLTLAGAGHALAASSVDLTVRGLITPSACEPTLSAANIDLGKISVNDLNIDNPTYMGDHVMQLTVTCDAATLVAIEPKDNRAGSDYLNEPAYFGLGLINGSEKLGSMSMGLDTVLADGVASRAIDSLDGGLTWIRHFVVGPDRITSVADTTTLVPVPVQVLTTNLSVSPVIAPASTLTLTNEAPIDGSVTLTVRYL